MSMVAIIPIGNLLSANTELETLGYGPNNFNLACYNGLETTHGALHCWDYPAFESSVQAIPNVVVEISTGDPSSRIRTLIEAQGATWVAGLLPLPSKGQVTAGSLYITESGIWFVIQAFNRSTFGDPPEVYPALIRRVRSPSVVEPWKQPLDQFDAYKLLNPFTGEADKCLWNGEVYETLIDNNTFSPTGFPAGWSLV